MVTVTMDTERVVIGGGGLAVITMEEGGADSGNVVVRVVTMVTDNTTITAPGGHVSDHHGDGSGKVTYFMNNRSVVIGCVCCYYSE